MPPSHCIVDGDTDDLVDPLGFDGIGLLDKAREMDLGTGAGECTGDGKQHDALAGEALCCRNRTRCPLSVQFENCAGGMGSPFWMLIRCSPP